MADLANEFKNGKEKLVPVFFSHGLGASWHDYQMVGMEMASNGMLVLMIDHHDGTCKYTELENG